MFNKKFKVGFFEFELDIWIILVLILAAIINFYNITRGGLSIFDEATYSYAAKKVLEGNLLYLGGGFKPLYMVFVTIGNLVFGIHNYSGTIISGLFGLLSIYITYLIGLKLFNRKIGTIAGLILAVTQYHVYFSKVTLAEVVSTAFYGLTILVYIYSYTAEKKAQNWILLLVSLLIGIHFLIRFNSPVIIGLLLVFEFIHLISKRYDLKILPPKRRQTCRAALYKATIKRALIICVPAILIILAISIVYWLLAPHNSNMAWQVSIRTTQGLVDLITRTGKEADFLYYTRGLWYLTSPITLILGLLGLFVYNKKTKFGNGSNIVTVWFLFLFLFYSSYYNHQMRLFLPAVPALALLAAKAIVFLSRPKADKLANPRLATFKSKIIQSILLTLVVSSSLFLSIGTITKSSLGYENASDYVISKNAGGVIDSQYGLYMYYFDGKIPRERQVRLEFVNSTEQLKNLNTEGYDYIILDWRGSGAPLRNELLKCAPDKVFEDSHFENDAIVEASRKNNMLLTSKLINYSDPKNMGLEDPYLFDNSDARNNFIYIYNITGVLKCLGE